MKDVPGDLARRLTLGVILRADWQNRGYLGVDLSDLGCDPDRGVVIWAIYLAVAMRIGGHLPPDLKGCSR
jgi:hypothetical protein